MIKFSIIVPVYNAEKHLSDTMDHTLQLGQEDFEIILVDDGSTGSSPEICDQYECQYPDRVRVIHQENQGQLVARWNGIQVASGDYCLFLDADDALSEGCLGEMGRILDEYGNPDMVIYSFRYEAADGTSKPAKKLAEESKLFADKEELYQLFFTSTLLNNVWTKLVRRDILLDCSLDLEKYKTLRCSEDRLHSMEIVTKAQTIVYTPNEWYRYRLGEGSVTRTYSPNNIEKFNDSVLYTVTRDYMIQWGMNDTYWQNRFHAMWVDHAVYVFDLFYMHSGEKRAVFAYDWSTFLPSEIENDYLTNPCINETKRQFMTWILKKDRINIDFYILKREIKRKLKAILKRK